MRREGVEEEGMMSGGGEEWMKSGWGGNEEWIVDEQTQEWEARAYFNILSYFPNFIQLEIFPIHLFLGKPGSKTPVPVIFKKPIFSYS